MVFLLFPCSSENKESENLRSLSKSTENRPKKLVEPNEWIRSCVCDSIMIGMLLFLHGKRQAQLDKTPSL